MKIYSQEKLLKKLKNLNDNSRPGILVKEYLINHYDLNELFKLFYDKDIKRLLSELRVYLIYYTESEIKMIDMTSCPDKKTAKELISYYIKTKLRLKKCCDKYLFDLVVSFEIYDKNILEYCNKEMLIEMCREDQIDKLFYWILYQFENGFYTYDYGIEIFTALRPFLSRGQKSILLNTMLCFHFFDNLRYANQNLLSEEFEYIRMRALSISGCYEDIICQFIYDDMLDDDKRKNHIDQIISQGYTKCGYKLLINANLTSEETKKLKDLLLRYKDEYYFYYLVKTNIKFLLNIFGSYISIEYFIKESFRDSKERKEVLDAIANGFEKEFKNVSEAYEKAINHPVYKVKPKRLKGK